MTIKRQYTLPNCNLILEGMSGEDINNLAAPMTILLNAECQFPGNPTPLVGGRDFLEGLIQAVNPYTQSLLSGITTTRAKAGTPVILEPHEAGPYHRLSLAITDKAEDTPPVEVKLTTVQLFDLMEAVDQLLADSQTLPDLTLALAPVARRETLAQIPLAQQAAPIAVGTSGLAAAAALLFFLPVPELEPIRIEETPNEEEVSTGTSAEAGTRETPNNEFEAEDTEAEGLDLTATDAQLSNAALTASRTLTRLNQAPTIEDEGTLTQLQTDLTETLEDDWAIPDDLDTPLTYRVAVSEDGDLLGYRPEDNDSLTNLEDTPLPGLAYIPVDIETVAAEPVAQFEVILAPDGGVTVTPVSDSENN